MAAEKYMEPGKLKRTSLGTLAVCLFIIAVIFFFVGRNNFIVRSIGVLAAAAGAIAARRARGLPPSVWNPEAQKALVLKPWHWLVGIALLAPVVISLAWMHQIALNGYRGSAFPLYMFAASAVVGGAWWSMLFARWLYGRRI